MSIAGKSLSKVILNKLNTHLIETVPESQYGFHQNSDSRRDIRCKTDPRECKEQNRDVYILFDDLTKAFDSVTPRTVKHTSANWNLLPKMAKIIA